MNILRSIRNGAHDVAGGGKSPEGGSLGGSPSLIADYERLNEQQAVAQLVTLKQVDLIAIEAFERSHRDRAPVLNKLRYLRQDEPVSGYDELDAAAVAGALSGADMTTVKSVREYERKFGDRPAALKEIAAALHRLSAEQAAAASGPDARSAARVG
jgi:hypothetical protein